MLKNIEMSRRSVASLTAMLPVACCCQVSTLVREASSPGEPISTQKFLSLGAIADDALWAGEDDTVRDSTSIFRTVYESISTNVVPCSSMSVISNCNISFWHA